MPRALKQYVDWWTNTKDLRVYPVLKGGVHKYIAAYYVNNAPRCKLCYTKWEVIEYLTKAEWQYLEV